MTCSGGKRLMVLCWDTVGTLLGRQLCSAPPISCRHIASGSTSLANPLSPNLRTAHAACTARLICSGGRWPPHACVRTQQSEPCQDQVACDRGGDGGSSGGGSSGAEFLAGASAAASTNNSALHQQLGQHAPSSLLLNISVTSLEGTAYGWVSAVCNLGWVLCGTAY